MMILRQQQTAERFQTSDFLSALRLKSPDNAKAIVADYTKKAKTKIVHQAAATAWAEGVPWAEALQIAEKAISAADATVSSLKFSAKGRGKGKGKAKGKAKGKR